MGGANIAPFGPKSQIDIILSVDGGIVPPGTLIDSDRSGCPKASSSRVPALMVIKACPSGVERYTVVGVAPDASNISGAEPTNCPTSTGWLLPGIRGGGGCGGFCWLSAKVSKVRSSEIAVYRLPFKLTVETTLK